MELTGIITDLSIDYETGNPKFTFLCNEKQTANLEQFKGLKSNLTIKKWFKKRSTNANDYCWVLCKKIAESLTLLGTLTTKEDIYKEAIREVGTYELMVASKKAAEHWKKVWAARGIGYQAEQIGEKDNMVKFRMYYGSSEYDSREMSILIKYLVEQAQQMGIDTRTKEEIESMMRNYSNDL